MYLTYSEYQSRDGVLSQIEFERAETAARKMIDSMTYQRLANVDPVPTDLKMCVLELVSRGLCGNLSGQDFTTSSAGKLSGTKEDRANRATEIIRNYLDGLSVNGIPVFYAGNV